MVSTRLLSKYNIALPRYTSYPTVPYWQDTPSANRWKESVSNTFQKTNFEQGISLYVHLPFCESMCTFCGCNRRITKNHQVEDPYIKSVLNEWELYCKVFNEVPRIKELHLGGGTPTFFSAENLKRLIVGLLAPAKITTDPQFGLEAHPNVTQPEQLKVLYDLGFRRLSLGIQDFTPYVQEMINRIQSYEQVKKITETARQIGYTSVNYDLVYGLPFQDQVAVEQTLSKVETLHPDRIAFYSYAHVPWKSKGQRRYTKNDLPGEEEKLRLYALGRSLLAKAGYREIGMDHFALPKDSLFKAAQIGQLHRNFMGYTVGKTDLLIGLGASAISDSQECYVQNEKTVEKYQQVVKSQSFPYFRGHRLTQEDRVLRHHIMRLMCELETNWYTEKEECPILGDSLIRLKPLEKDGLVELDKQAVRVTRRGHPFIRNICMAFDQRLWAQKPGTKLFSQSI